MAADNMIAVMHHEGRSIEGEEKEYTGGRVGS